jgi:hypothetical protein
MLLTDVKNFYITHSLQFCLILFFILVVTNYFFILNYSYENFGNELIRIQEKYFEQISEDSKKIYIIGNSMTLAINPDRIENELQEYEVYNLSIGGYNLEQRIRTLEQILEKKPEMIILGISYRDFEMTQREINFSTESEENISWIKVEYTKFSNEVVTKFPFLESPRYYFHKVIFGSHDFVPESAEGDFNSKTPFFIPEEKNFKVIPNKKIFDSEPKIPIINSWDNNSRIKFTDYFLKELLKNDIDIVLVSVPLHKVANDSMSENTKRNFNEIINNLTNVNKIAFLDLRTKYQNLEIWLDSEHISFGESSNIYTDDIIKKIKEEI